MKEIKRTEVKNQIVYEITKEELEAIKITERNKGRVDILSYLVFSIKNYRWEFNLKGIKLYFENLIDFLDDKTTIIENIYGYSFHYYVDNIKE